MAARLGELPLMAEGSFPAQLVHACMCADMAQRNVYRWYFSFAGRYATKNSLQVGVMALAELWASLVITAGPAV